MTDARTVWTTMPGLVAEDEPGRVEVPIHRLDEVGADPGDMVVVAVKRTDDLVEEATIEDWYRCPYCGSDNVEGFTERRPSRGPKLTTGSGGLNCLDCDEGKDYF